MLVTLLVLDQQNIAVGQSLINHCLRLARCFFGTITSFKGYHEVVRGVAVEVTLNSIGLINAPNIIATILDDALCRFIHLKEAILSLTTSWVNEICILALPVLELLKF